jgi:4-hydroxybenzoate polyprenyltransferase
MGRYVVLLIAPVIVGVLIAAGIVVINGLRQRRIDARRTQPEARRPGPSSELTRRRIAS